MASTMLAPDGPQWARNLPMAPRTSLNRPDTLGRACVCVLRVRVHMRVCLVLPPLSWTRSGWISEASRWLRDGVPRSAREEQARAAKHDGKRNDANFAEYGMGRGDRWSDVLCLLAQNASHGRLQSGRVGHVHHNPPPCLEARSGVSSGSHGFSVFCIQD